jgi:hypothetical protein
MSQDYLMFDEPTLEQVTPDCLVVPAIKGNKILEIAGKETKHPNNLTELDIKDALFVEIKAYHKTTKVGEKEILQTYNYGIKGGKAILITTGELDRFDKLDMLKDIELEPVKDGEEMVFQEAAYQEFIRQVKSKNKGHIKALDMSISQDSYDTRGIYYSAHKKLQKIHKYTKDWPEGFQYSLLDSPQKILDFLTSEETLGIVKSGAFLKLLQQKGLDKAADLFFQIQERYLEEIIVNPSFLYPTIPHK